MQFTVIAVQKNGQQVILGQDMQEHSVERVIRAAVDSSLSVQVRQEAKYRSFFALGTTAHTTCVLRYDGNGGVVHRTAGLV